jgi:hypothetical protein
MAVISDDGYDRLLHLIGSTLTKPRRQATALANIRIQKTDRQLSQHLAEFDQKGPVISEYGAGRTSFLAQALTLHLGKGYSRSDVKAIRRFDWLLPKSQTPSGLLSWTRVVKRWHLANWGIGCKHTRNRTVIQRDALASFIPSANSQFSILHSQLSWGFAWQ